MKKKQEKGKEEVRRKKQNKIKKILSFVILTTFLKPRGHLSLQNF